jgi:hypothetical protein
MAKGNRHEGRSLTATVLKIYLLRALISSSILSSTACIWLGS